MALKKEAVKLEKVLLLNIIDNINVIISSIQEYEDIQNQRKSAETIEDNLKSHYLQIKNSNDQGLLSLSLYQKLYFILENHKNAKEYEELNNLRELKKKL